MARKDIFIHKDGKTIAPYPIYLGEIKDSPNAMGVFKGADIDIPSLDKGVSDKILRSSFESIKGDLGEIFNKEKQVS